MAANAQMLRTVATAACRLETPRHLMRRCFRANFQANLLQLRLATTTSSAAARGGSSPLLRYSLQAEAGEIKRDARQERVVALLDEVCKKVSGFTPTPGPSIQARPAAKPSASPSSSWLGGLFGSSSKPVKAALAPATPAEIALPPLQGPKGLYVWGGCGTGKTFLMDLFYDAVPVKQKKRIHFHEWMIDVHERLHRLQKQGAMVRDKANTVWTAEGAKAQREQLKAQAGHERGSSSDDLVAQVAKEMLGEAWLLCFDEFQVTHISDAILMKRLFSVMFEQGAVVVATSNRPPQDLYLNGLNRSLFLPFIPMLTHYCSVYDIASEVDYRLTTTGEEEDRRVYIHPNGKEEQKLLERKFYRLCHGEDKVLVGGQVETQGRRIIVPKASASTKVAWFRFKDLCDKPLGAADYLAIASTFHTIFIADIPKLTLQERDQVRRFITLIDAFYERHTKLVCTADKDAVHLFEVSEDEKKNSSFDEVFAWDRTVSRLIEMQSVKYLSVVARSLDGEQFLGQFNFKALNDEDIAEMWRRYDKDESGELDRQEVRCLLEDILEKHQGHRNVSDDVLDLCMEKIDIDKNGTVSFEELSRYMSDFSLVSSTIRI